MTSNKRQLIAERNLSKAGALLHSLAPRASVFCFYDEDGECLWSSDSSDDVEVDTLVSELPDEVISEMVADKECLRRSLPSARVAVVFPVFSGGRRHRIGLLVTLFSKSDGDASALNTSLLNTILEPALDVIGESMRIGNELHARAKSASELEKELEFVYDVDDRIYSASGQHSSLAHLVGRSGRHLNINYSVLLIPGKRIRISATHSSWKELNRRAIDRYLTDNLLPKLQGHRRPVNYKIPTIKDDGNESQAGYRALLCPVRDPQGNVIGAIAQLIELDERKFTKSERRFMAHMSRKAEYVIEQTFDAATGLMNSDEFSVRLKDSFASLTEDDDTHHLIYCDLDSLQLINDNFGRDAGDDVILRVARMLEEDLPRSAIVSRINGDEFCMLLTHTTAEEALSHAQMLRDAMASMRYLEGDKSLQVTMSIGIAAYDNSVKKSANVITTARMACESAKEHGRDRIEVYDQGNRSVVRRYDDMQLVTDIQNALDGDDFELLAQPICSLKLRRRIPRFEVLLRMNDGEGGWVESAALFSAAERYRMMPQIDRWVISNIFAKIAESKELIESQKAVFAINLSGQSIGDDEFLAFIEAAIDEHDISPSTLCFEITESEAVSNQAKATSFIDTLRQRGCLISLDDFGAGLSSFAYLKNFDVDTLKIDGGFIRDIIDNRISESMVAAITQVAKVLQLHTVAEYVATPEIRDRVAELGVDYAQGYLFGKPTPIETVIRDMAEESAA